MSPFLAYHLQVSLAYHLRGTFYIYRGNGGAGVGNAEARSTRPAPAVQPPGPLLPASRRTAAVAKRSPQPHHPACRPGTAMMEPSPTPPTGLGEPLMIVKKNWPAAGSADRGCARRNRLSVADRRNRRRADKSPQLMERAP